MIPSIKRLALSLGFTLGLGFVPQGCGAAPPALEMPESIALPLRTCALEHRNHLGTAPNFIDFKVKLKSDGQVDKVAILYSTLGDEDLEKCMAIALKSLSEDDLPLRRSENRDRDLAPESRAFVGHPEALVACLASAPCLLRLKVFASAPDITVTLHVYATNAPRPPPAKPQVEEVLKDPRSGVGDAAGDQATSLSSSDAGSSKVPPPGGLTFVDITPASFPFVTTVQDDGTDKGGGSQVAKVNLEFRKIRIPTSVITWWCRFNIEMPLRTEKMGRVDARRAASLSVEVTQPVAYAMDYDLPQGIFCIKFINNVDVAFKAKYQFLGARVMK